jgi:DNA-binding XRE family transcriptional regulator
LFSQAKHVILTYKKIITASYDLYRNHYTVMPKSITRTYSRYNREAVALLAGLIRAARKERKLTTQEVADRAGISRGLLQRIEKGDMKCEIGVVFEVATIVGVKLFDADEPTLTRHIHQIQDKLSLLPKSVRKTAKVADDAF